MKQAPARAPVVHLPRWLGELSPNPSCLHGGAVLSFVLTRFLTRTGAHPASSAGRAFAGKRYLHSLTSTKCPAIAAAAAMAGDTRWVRPLNPWRPSKLRFDVEAQRSCGLSLSGFMARHIEQPGSRHSKPALIKIL